MTKLLGAEHVEALQSQIKESTEKLSSSISELKSSIDSIKDSNDAFVESQKKYQFWLCVLTFGLILATLTQAYVVFWSSKPQRTIEMYQELEKWSDSLRNK